VVGSKVVGFYPECMHALLLVMLILVRNGKNVQTYSPTTVYIICLLRFSRTFSSIER
jgi:hypothetical protein